MMTIGHRPLSMTSNSRGGPCLGLSQTQQGLQGDWEGMASPPVWHQQLAIEGLPAQLCAPLSSCISPLLLLIPHSHPLLSIFLLLLDFSPSHTFFSPSAPPARGCHPLGSSLVVVVVGFRTFASLASLTFSFLLF